MASLRDTRRRIGSVKNTRQITKAMKMVAGAKLRRAQDRAVQARPYAEALRTVLARVVAAAGDGVSHPLLTAPTEVKKVLVVVMSSDRGLCGAFNGNLLRKSEAFCEELAGKGLEVQLRTYGKKSAAHFRGRRFPVQDSVIDLHATKYVGMSQDLAGHLTSQFQAGEVHEVWLASNRFKSVINQEPTFIKVLPLSVEAGEDAAAAAEYKYEPSGQQILDTLLPLQLQTTLLQALLENEAGEHAARMAAMDAATRNASELIDSLTLEYNRARQAAITKELIEIVSGASAL